jgi:hypothetical protein
MTSRQKQISAAVIIAAAAIAAYAGWNWRAKNDPNFPDGAFYICANPACKHEFGMTMKQVGEHHEKHWGDPIPCPKCKESRTIRAERCPHCGKIYPKPRDVMPCPSCGKMKPPPEM